MKASSPSSPSDQSLEVKVLTVEDGPAESNVNNLSSVLEEAEIHLPPVLNGVQYLERVVMRLGHVKEDPKRTIKVVPNNITCAWSDREDPHRNVRCILSLCFFNKAHQQRGRKPFELVNRVKMIYIAGKKMRRMNVQDESHSRCGSVEPGQFPFKRATLIITGFFECCSFDLFHYADAISLGQQSKKKLSKRLSEGMKVLLLQMNVATMSRYGGH